MTTRNIEIVCGPEPRFEVNGNDIANGVTEATVTLMPGGGARVEVTLAADVVEVTGLAMSDPEFLLSLPDGARDALIALGWTPPTSTAACNDWSMSKEHTAHEWDGDVRAPGHFTCPGWPPPAGDQ